MSEGQHPEVEQALRPRGAGEILGLDNVRLDFPLASLGSRVLAAAVDYLLLLILQGLWWLGGAILLGFLDLGTGWVVAMLTVGAFLLQWGYFAVLEIAMDGTTPGKSLVGLRVVSHLGGKAGAASILLRNFLRAIDLFFGIPVMAIDRRARRLGDLVAGTLVVHQWHRTSDDEWRLGRLPAGWGAPEVAFVEGFLSRAERMEKDRAESLADRLLSWIARQDPELLSDLEPAADKVATLRRALAVKEG